MLLAICIFLLLTVIGINVMAASHSNVQNVKARYETEQSMQYVNSIYEIVDQKIRNGAFILDGYLSLGDEAIIEDAEISKTSPIQFKAGNNETIVTFVVFYKTKVVNELKAKIYIEYEQEKYYITSVYEYQKSKGDVGGYDLKYCEGVTSGEE